MGNYRKKPVVIEAFQFDGRSNTDPSVPTWFVDAVLAGNVTASPDHIAIKTLEGEMRADPGDWIICGVKGELYPCKPDIFAETYEPADAAASISRNQIITPRQMPGEDSILETFAAASDMAESIGPAVVIAPYKPPRDPRVRGVLRAAAKEPAAEAEAKPREIFRDPRLDPSYGKKKK